MIVVERIGSLLAISLAGVVIIVSALNLPIGFGFGTIAGVTAIALVRNDLRTAHLSALIMLVLSALTTFSGGLFFIWPAGILYLVILLNERLQHRRRGLGPIASARTLAILGAAPIIFDTILMLIFRPPKFPGPHGFPPGEAATIAGWSWIVPAGMLLAAVLGLIGAFQARPLLGLLAFGISLILPVVSSQFNPLILLCSICFLASSRSAPAKRLDHTTAASS